MTTYAPIVADRSSSSTAPSTRSGHGSIASKAIGRPGKPSPLPPSVPASARIAASSAAKRRNFASFSSLARSRAKSARLFSVSLISAFTASVSKMKPASAFTRSTNTPKSLAASRASASRSASMFRSGSSATSSTPSAPFGFLATLGLARRGPLAALGCAAELRVCLPPRGWTMRCITAAPAGA